MLPKGAALKGATSIELVLVTLETEETLLALLKLLFAEAAPPSLDSPPLCKETALAFGGDVGNE